MSINMSIKVSPNERLKQNVLAASQKATEAIRSSTGLNPGASPATAVPERLSGKIVSGTDTGIIDSLNQAKGNRPQQDYSGQSSIPKADVNPTIDTNLSNFSKNEVLQQAGKSAMAPSSQAPSQSALNLLKQSG